MKKKDLNEQIKKLQNEKFRLRWNDATRGMNYKERKDFAKWLEEIKSQH